MYYSFIPLKKENFLAFFFFDKKICHDLLVLIRLISLVENNLENPCLRQTGSVGNANNLYICI